MQTIRRSFLTCIALISLAATCAAQQNPIQTQTPPVARLTLKSAVDQAVRNSRDVQLAKLEATLAEKTAAVDRSIFGPNLYTGTGFAYSSGFPLAPGGGVPAIFTLSYQQSLFNPLAKGTQRADESRARAQKANVDNVRDAVMMRAASTYLELTKVRHSLEVLHTERDGTQKQSELMRDRVAAGYELPIEQTKADLRGAVVDQLITDDEARQDSLENDLRDLLGLLSDQPLDLAVEDLPPSANQPVAVLVAQAIASSSDVRQAESEQQAKLDILKGTKNSRWPTIDLVGSYSVLSNTNHYTEFFNKFERNNVNFGIQASVPVYAARASATIAEAKANVSVAEVQAKSKRSEIERKVRGQAYLVHRWEQAVKVARLDRDLAQENLKVAQAQFDQGRATRSELEQAHLNESDKWRAFFDADFQRQIAELALLQLTGQIGKVLQ
jgi:outer membrane protein TolC